MRNYLVLTPVRGLPRADQSRDPVAAGEVVALPSAKAMELGVIQAVEPSEAEATLLLEWPDVLVAPGALAGLPFSPPTPPIAVVAVTDRHALVHAIEELGGTVFFVGDGLPDDAEDVLPDFSNEQLLDELDDRVESGRLHPSMIRPRYEAVEAEQAPGQDEAPATATSDAHDASGEGDAPAAAVSPAVAPPAEAKPARKKAPAK